MVMETTRFESDWLAERFEQHRNELTGVAYRLLGSRTEADDAVQEAWLRLSCTARGNREPRRLADHCRRAYRMFALSFEEIAAILERSPEAARQLASRARRRVRGATPPSDSDPAAEPEVVEAFLAAARDGDFDGLLVGPGNLMETTGWN